MTKQPARSNRPGPEEVRVAETLEQIRAGVRQRQAELATLADQLREGPATVVQLQRAQHLQEPVCVSPRPLLGPLIVFVRKAVYHLFLKWYLRSHLEQQNAFNHAAVLAVQELVERQTLLAMEQARLAESLEELRQRLVPRDS